MVREVREEVGVEVANLEYIGSQNWPFPHSLMLGFHAEYVSGEIVPQEDGSRTPSGSPSMPCRRYRRSARSPGT